MLVACRTLTKTQEAQTCEQVYFDTLNYDAPERYLLCQLASSDTNTDVNNRRPHGILIMQYS